MVWANWFTDLRLSISTLWGSKVNLDNGDSVKAVNGPFDRPNAMTTCHSFENCALRKSSPVDGPAFAGFQRVKVNCDWRQPK